MARVPYVTQDSHPQLAERIAAISAQRRGKLINIYGMLLHSPDVAAGWMELISAVRWNTTLQARLRELVIIRVAFLNGVDYVVNVHRQHYAAADGLGAAECEALLQPRVDPCAFSSEDLAVIALTDAMTRDIAVDDDVYAEVRRHFDTRQVVELSVLVGAYNMHTRVARALQIDPD